jgi:hypothetical protein
MTIQIKQSSTYSAKDWWDWSVWIEAPKKELDVITHVIYTLHSTFRDPVRVIKKRSNGFRLDSAGWGEFKIYIEIVRATGKSLKRVHQLKLEYPAEPDAIVPQKPSGRAVMRPGPKAPRKDAGLPEQHPTVYVSNGAADSDLARQLKEKLKSYGVTIASPDDLEAGQQWDHFVKQAIKKSDATVFIVSGKPSLWSKLEMGYAVNAEDKNVIPLLVGTAAEVPEALANRSALHIGSSAELDAATAQILQATKAKA